MPLFSGNNNKMKKFERTPKQAHAEALTRIASCVEEKGTVLDLSNLGIKSLPPEIAAAHGVQFLQLTGNLLTSLPPEITSLSSLNSIFLSNNSFASVPPQVFEIPSLQALDIGANRLKNFPDALWSMPNLVALAIHNNGLTSLPAELVRLPKLRNVYAYKNLITEIPAEICEMEYLEGLHLFSNQIHTLSSAIGKLKSLTTLDLYANQLESLPVQIRDLRKLSELDLGANRLGRVPSELRHLTSLTSLDLRSNNLKSLPEWLRELPNLRNLSLRDNPSLKLPPSLLGTVNESNGQTIAPPPSVVLDYYFESRASGARPLNEVKLVLVGRGGAGKTSTVRALRDQSFNEAEDSTPGVALCDWKMEGCRGAPVTAHIWDFAGQVITHALHQFFFSMRSIYIVVLTGRENSERDDAEYWLRLIKAFGTDDKGQGPPVIIALNKWDVPGCRPKVDRAALQERYPFIQAFVEVDCSSKRGVSKLQATLCREVDRLKWVRQPFPHAWDQVRRSLTTGRRKKAHMTYAEFRELCHSHGVDDERQQDSLAEVLHNLGIALNYRNDPRLREATILQPEWLTKNVYSLLRRAEKQSGIVKQLDIQSVLRYEKDESMRAYLLRIMERFEIAYSPRANDDVWLLPQALPDEQPKGVLTFRDVADATRLRYTYPALPEGLVARAIVRLSEFIEDVGSKKQQWASGAILAREGARALIRTEHQDRQVMITVTGPLKSRQQLAGLCQAEMRDIHSEIRGLDPVEETQVQGLWISTAALEMDERKRQQTGVATKDRGTILIDPVESNNAYSAKLARSDHWKPTVFISYSKSDVKQRKQLEAQLKILMNEGLVNRIWHDRMIDPGDYWDDTIQAELKNADVIIVLVSSAALSTDYITRYEIPKALELHKIASAVVVPVILESCRWHKTHLGELNALPEKGNPLKKWKPPSDGWNSVADGLAKICEKLMAEAGAKAIEGSKHTIANYRLN